MYNAGPITHDDLPGYAGRIFDFALANPEVLRLMHWSALERKEGPLPARTAATEVKLKAVAKAQREGLVGREFTPAFLLTAMLILASAWTGWTLLGRASILTLPSICPRSVRPCFRLGQGLLRAFGQFVKAAEEDRLHELFVERA